MRIAGRSRKTSTTVGTDAATSRTCATVSSAKSSEPAWKKFSNIVGALLVRRLQAQDRDVGLGGRLDDLAVLRRDLGRDALDVEPQAARERAGSARRRRRHPLLGFDSRVIDARCAASPAARNSAAPTVALGGLDVDEGAVEQAEHELLAQQAACGVVEALLAHLALLDEVDEQLGDRLAAELVGAGVEHLAHALARS